MRLFEGATASRIAWLLCSFVVSEAGCSRESSSPQAAPSSLVAMTNDEEIEEIEDRVDQSYEQLTNSRFTSGLNEMEAVPHIQAIALPPQNAGAAIWGATGCDDQGHIWFAVSPYEGEELSARLFEYDPTRNAVTDRGDVLSEARKAGIYSPGMQQPKIHTKILQASDGHLYFVSSNENPRGIVGRKAPIWGSHLWRLRLPERHWEHLAAWEEGVLALGGGGNALYGLAFPDHTLIRYDIAKGETKKVKVGSVEGHISRNLLVDGNGIAYVPRLMMTGADIAEHTLVAFDSDLKEVGSHPLPYYQQASDQQPASLADQFHGITGFCYLADNSIAFTTHAGRLYRLAPEEGGAGRLDDLGWLHPDGKSYASSLFTLAGTRYVYGLPMVVRDNHDVHDLVCFDLVDQSSRIVDAELPEVDGISPLDSSLYGSNTCDHEGAFIVCGAYSGGAKLQPVALRIGWEQAPSNASNE